jgi:hypothetical protein
MLVNVLFEGVLYKLCDPVRAKRHTVALSETFDARVCGQLQEDEIRASVVGRWVRYHIRFEVFYLHRLPPLFVS